MKELYWKAVWHAAGGKPDTDDAVVRGRAIGRGRDAVLAMNNLELLKLLDDVLDAEHEAQEALFEEAQNAVDEAEFLG